MCLATTIMNVSNTVLSLQPNVVFKMDNKYVYNPILRNIKVPHRFINQIYHPVVRYKTCHQHRLQENNTYLLQSEDRKVEEAKDINKGFRKYINYNTLTHAI